MPRRPLIHSSSAFSLVEVTLALGIVAFSLLTLVGLIPMGLTTFHKAVNASISSQIVQQVVTDMQQTDFSQLTQSIPIRYFDDQGNELGTANNPPPAGTIINYDVNVVVTTPTGTSNLACLQIEIVTNPGQQTLNRDSTGSVQQDPAHGIFVSRYSAFIANNQ